jgi:DNA polymerase II large subunit
MRPDDERYFERLEEGLDEALSVAREARRRGGDPTDDVEIPIAKDMADRVENILGIDGVAERVREMEADPDLSREEAALELAADFAEGTVGDYDTRAGKIEGAVRTAVALLTEGVVAAPIEGIDRVELLENDDGTEFVNIYYAGPIRSAGGTAQALSVLVADYTRTLLGIQEYDARSDEVERYAEELSLYDNETGLQYAPKDKEAKFIARHMPVMLDGEATGDEEVSGFRDLERVDTNNARGGMCLVLGEGIAQKAPKIQRYTSQLEAVEWPWLQDLIDGDYSGDAAEGKGNGDGENATADGENATADNGGAESDESGGAEKTNGANGGAGTDETGELGGAKDHDSPPRPDPTDKFLRDLIAGRPVFGHPSEVGGFRLRYGRARNHGFATAGVHPATMHLVDDFLATGTQIKTERPGKAAGVIPVDTIEGPTVRLANGDVRRVDDPEEALEIRNGVEAILDLGEYLVNYGEFVENNHPLSPAGYAPEWWRRDLEAAGADVQALSDSPRVDLEHPEAEQALEWVETYDAPLHPEYTYLWHDLDVERFEALVEAASAGHWAEADGATGARDRTEADRAATQQPRTGLDRTLVVEHTDPVREALEVLLVEHEQGEGTLTIPDAVPLVRSLGLSDDLERTWEGLSAEARRWDGGANAMQAVNEVAPFEIRERAPTRIGCRMGRPEKSEKRDLSPAVHTLFPINEAGGPQRNVADAAKHADSMRDTPGELEVQLGRRRCPDCSSSTFRARCPECNAVTEPRYVCYNCDIDVEPDESGRAICPNCESEADAVQRTTIDVGEEYRSALENVGERENAFGVLKGVQGLSSKHKVPEPIEKGILRAKNGVSAFKDGTVRYDMTDLPVTSVRAAELDVSVGQLQSLGYEEDIHGQPLTHEEQLVELRVQDVVLSEGAAEHMLRTADFVDDLLEQYYGMEPYYEVEAREDLIGELVFGMAPHTSAAVVGRVIGFTSAAVGYAHPYFHAAKRRNCFHPETKLWYEDDDGWHHRRVETLVESQLEDPESDDFGTLIQELDGEVSVPSLTEDGELVQKSVTAVSKHTAPEHMVRVETRSGREMIITPDHEMQVYDTDTETVVGKRASGLSEEDHLVTPRHLDVIDSKPATFDLLEEFLRLDSVPTDRLMIEGMSKSELYDIFEKVLSNDWDGRFYPLKSTAEYLGITKKSLSNYLYRERIPVTVLLDIFDDVSDLLETLPETVSLGLRRDSTSIDRTVEVNERVATLLGYYAAEGFTREQETPKGTIQQTTICGTEAQAREFYLESLESAFGVEPYVENDAKITVSGRLLRVFFEDVLNAGTGAADKRIPECILRGDSGILSAYLSGYFSGDGSVEDGRLVINATTVSQELKEDLFGVLTRLGIKARVDTQTPIPVKKNFPEYYDEDDGTRSAVHYVLTISSDDTVKFYNDIGFHLTRKQIALSTQVENIPARNQRVFDGGSDDVFVESIDTVEYEQADLDAVYCLTVTETNALIANDVGTKQCDGDEDCVMLLMDGIVNFSKTFLPDQRGGKMDAPLVMSSRIDPAEIDDEAHNMDIVSEYPREFYEATREMADPGEVDGLIRIGEDTLGTDDQYRGFEHTHDTVDIAAGPDLSAYKTLGDMMEKMNAQLELSRKLRSVDETDVAERVIEYHFLPDIIGNLRAFSRQETRCLDCGEKFRRVPLTSDCRECGGRVNLTVHEGSVKKYIDTAIQVAEEYGCREYTKQRLRILDRAVESVFEDDTNKQSGIADFM